MITVEGLQGEVQVSILWAEGLWDGAGGASGPTVRDEKVHFLWGAGRGEVRPASQVGSGSEQDRWSARGGRADGYCEGGGGPHGPRDCWPAGAAGIGTTWYVVLS